MQFSDNQYIHCFILYRSTYMCVPPIMPTLKSNFITKILTLPSVLKFRIHNTINCQCTLQFGGCETGLIYYTKTSYFIFLCTTLGAAVCIFISLSLYNDSPTHRRRCYTCTMCYIQIQTTRVDGEKSCILMVYGRGIHMSVGQSVHGCVIAFNIYGHL